MKEFNNYYKDHASSYDKTWKSYTQVTHEKTLQYIPPDLTNRSILDYGCGTGEFIIRLLSLHPDAHRIVGLDPSENMLEMARAKVALLPSHQSGKIELANSTSYPLETEAFDLVISMSAFHYFNDPEAELKRLKQTLKRAGTMVLLDYSKNGVLAKYFEWVIKLVDQGHHKAYTVEEAKKIAQGADYKVLESDEFQVDALWKGWIMKMVWS